MPDTSWEIHFARLVADFLTAADPVETGIPAAADLPRYVMGDEGEISLPCLEISSAPEGVAHPALTLQAVTIMLHVQAVDTEGKNGTLTSTSQAWLQSLRRRLSDTAAWQSFLSGLTEEQRTGWRILKLRLLSTGEREMDPAKRLFTEKLALRLHVQISGH